MSESKNHQIMHAQIDWSDQSGPFSPVFGDLDFNTDQNIADSHSVFLQGNQLTERWSTWQGSHFCIAETAFGCGINFLLTCLAFDNFLRQNPDNPLKKLFFSSFEKSPLNREDLQRALQQWPTLSAYITPLLDQYPLALRGCHRIHIGNITLDLWFGDINNTLPNLYIYDDGLFDCWFLNGFAPSKNADMWNEPLFKLIAACSKANATIAAFTVESFVKSGLETAGFVISKREGICKKREMLFGHIKQPTIAKQYAENYRPPKLSSSKDIAIIGAGISGVCLSLALVKRGYSVTMYCKDGQLGCGASGNQQGALYPLLNARHDALSELFANSFLYARNYVEKLNQRHPFDFDLSGLLQLYYDDSAAKKLDKILLASLPTALVQKVTSEQTDQLAELDIGQSALFYPLAGWLSPTQMVHAIAAKAEKSGRLTIKLNHQLDTFEEIDKRWHCHFTVDGAEQKQEHSLMVLASAMHTLDFKQCEALPLSAARGQVTHVPTNQQLQKLKITLCHEGYLTPINNGAHCMGATFNRHSMDETFSATEQIENKDKLAKCIKEKQWVEQIDIAHEHANVGIRCTTRDHFPYMGALPDYLKTKLVYQHEVNKMPSENAPFHPNLFILTGLGSRGLNTGPLLAETLASQINQEPLPLSLPILNALQCNRQWINYLKKGKTLKF
ncbi:tRNA 5-methylaminomethyl-2-thiouridine biosynthesis bifunctional protein MnmC [Psychromonas marina]|uniref:tRNA 5-methylaminomethyl-2-thiouridine biosynthesis bifunctional protein MnmC n=1 Tax=Psychromonas marina TaxID=88364 RepID=A0ABQ6E2B3_9GAMM|nr:bifunctional tRNA (5-methylaminomethyl-2-thiouridine)(34)-methyltransferase MnmD/FAD-dependent 5-carboxymethylaminomethyl-2-thiouridine(34) oxidoreductase MnmC [Psychromonas marina]GLS91517.1 tRNA 5-methylaminomethyl-2-thiouridine biosynthesis bifunctional protein MnmC [Psychromonas marina]